jgi:hypothetical protein
MTDNAHKNRTLGIGLCLAAAACLFYGAFTRTWLFNSSHYEERGFGLRDAYECMSVSDTEQRCKRQSNSDFIEQWKALGDSAAQYVSSAFAPMGWATLVASLLAALGLVGAAALAFANKRPDLPMTPTTIALLGIMIGLITGCVFVATKPGPTGFVGVGLSFWAFGIGAVGGIAGAQILAKVNRPEDPDLMDDAMNPDHY